MAALICSADALHAFGAANYRKTLTAAIARPSRAVLGCTVSTAAASHAIARSHGHWQHQSCASADHWPSSQLPALRGRSLIRLANVLVWGVDGEASECAADISVNTRQLR